MGLLFSIALTGSAYVVFAMGVHDAATPQWWALQMSLLFSLVMAAAMVWRLPSLGRFFCVMFIGYSLGADVRVEILLMAALLWDLILLSPAYVGALVAPVLVVLSVAYQTQATVLGRLVDGPTVSGLIFYVSTLTAVCVGVTLLKRQRLRTRAVSERLSHLAGTVAKLTEANLWFQNYALEIGERTTEEERKRISRDLHDTVGFTLTNIKMMHEAALHLVRDEQSELYSLLSESREMLQQSISDTRITLRALRTVQSRTMLFPTVERIVKMFEKATHVDVKVDYCNLPNSLGYNVEFFVYRMLQEGMVNVFRHGRATRIQVIFWVESGTLTVSLSDNGRSASKPMDGIGLSGMRERAMALGGSFLAERRSPGFEIRARLPLRRVGEYAED